jgi:hypothetical protein
MMNLPTIIIIAGLALLVILAVRYIARNGISCAEGCSGSCGTCSGNCGTGNTEKLDNNEYYRAVDRYFAGKEKGAKHV